MRVVSKISGAAGALGDDTIDLRNWIIHFGCALEELRVVFADLVDCMDPPTPCATYSAVMENRLVALDKRPGVIPMGIRETIFWAFTKFVLRAK